LRRALDTVVALAQDIPTRHLVDNYLRFSLLISHQILFRLASQSGFTLGLVVSAHLLERVDGIIYADKSYDWLGKGQVHGTGGG